MTPLKDKIKSGMQECHILVLGAQVLLGFKYSAVFQKGFDQLSESTRYLSLGSLVLMLVALCLLLGAVAYHQMADGGADSEPLHRFITAMAGWALLPFAGGIGLALYVSAEKTVGREAALLFGLGSTVTALFFWYGLEAISSMNHPVQHRKPSEDEKPEGEEPEKTPVKNKIENVLEEVRVILPGAQALLGFQLASMLVEGFDTIPASSKYLHLASLSSITLSVILLMTPAAYHRLVEHGEQTERFHRFASRTILAALVPLALGLCGDLYVVTLKVTGSSSLSLGLSLVMLACCYGLWFGFTLCCRQRPEESAGDPHPQTVRVEGERTSR